MKLLKRITLLLFIGVLSIQTHAQLSLGGQSSFLKVGSVGSYMGLGVIGNVGLSDKNMVTFGFNYYLPSSTTYSTTGYAFSSATDPSSVDVSADEKIGFMHFFVGGKRYFVGETDGDFNVYGIAEFGLLMASVSTDYSEFDETLYEVYTSEDETITQITIDFGIGAEKELGFGYVFSDFKFNLPANKQNGQIVAVKIPASLSFNVGVRIPFD